MADIKLKYPVSSSVPITISCGALASNAAQNVFVAGRESDAVDNTINLDLDHLLSGKIKSGTSPTAGRSCVIYIYASLFTASGTPTYGDVLDGVDSNETFTSANVQLNCVRPAATIILDNTTGRDYHFGPISIASLFGGKLPKFWGIFVAQDSTVNLAANNTDHVFEYERVQGQVV